MTDTEAKALALVNEAAGRPLNQYMVINRSASFVTEALCRAIEREEATEARHAAEMRELKERFGEAVCSWRDACTPVDAAKAAARLHDFILPAPDPLVEVAREMTLLDGVVRTDNQKAAIREGHAGNTASEDFYDRLRAAMQARGYQVTKIGEAGQ